MTSSSIPSGMFGCPRCDNLWSGMNTGHCSVCHETFTGITAFDAHRAGPWSNRRCLDPADAGLVDAGRKYMAWRIPDKEEPEE